MVESLKANRASGTSMDSNPHSQTKAELHQCENSILIAIFSNPKAMPSSHKLDYTFTEEKIDSAVQCVITPVIMLKKMT